MWNIIFYLIVIILAIYLSSSKKGGPEPRPASLEDVEAPTADQGRAIPVVFGTMVVKAPNIVWYGDLKYRQVKDRP